MKKIDRVRSISHKDVDKKHPLSKFIAWKGPINRVKAIRPLPDYSK